MKETLSFFLYISKSEILGLSYYGENSDRGIMGKKKKMEILSELSGEKLDKIS
jgi:hypothetical protein